MKMCMKQKKLKFKQRTSFTTKYSTLNIKPAQKDAMSGKHIRAVIVTKALFSISIESSFASANV